jgi:tetratricopeptide (TPR) repeat protein
MGIAVFAAFVKALNRFKDCKFRQASTYFEGLVKLNPANDTVRYYLGLTYLELSRIDLAKAQFKMVLTLNGTYGCKALYHLLLASILAEDWGEAHSLIEEMQNKADCLENDMVLRIKNELQANGLISP